MVHQTFYNLPEEKRERIVNAAIGEFSAYPYLETNINRIVAAAKIPKGSFYQYFDGKDDLYKYCALLVYKKIFDFKKRENKGFFRPARERVAVLGFEKTVMEDRETIEGLVGKEQYAFLLGMKAAPEELRILVNLHVAERLIYPELSKELSADSALRTDSDTDFLAFLLSIAELVAMEYGSLKNKDYMELNACVYSYMDALYRAFSK